MYVIDVFLFAAIPWIKWRRARKEAKKLDYNEIAGVVDGQHRQTFKIGKSLSKSSLKDEEVAGYQQQQAPSTGYQQQQPSGQLQNARPTYNGVDGSESADSYSYGQQRGATDPLNAVPGKEPVYSAGANHAAQQHHGGYGTANNADDMDYFARQRSNNSAGKYGQSQQNYADGYMGH